MAIETTLNEVLVRLFHDVLSVEERVLSAGAYKMLTVNDMHVIEQIGPGKAKSMSAVAKDLSVTVGTLTISINSLVKKGFVNRVRSEKDKRVVLVSLTERGKKAYARHAKFHQLMIDAAIKDMTPEEQEVLEGALKKLLLFFKRWAD